ncbi:FtsB/FtsL family cell division protein [Endobacterium cereale]|uniref:hypothetical protein n=1 Tax=Endobacterium cereale TaxID=2663029 RepID=UPI002B4A7968|nr:hypothetical protein [Endobacterium cereale]MEB2846499.1 hypothetical protein [Endobacterium cereale]
MVASFLLSGFVVIVLACLGIWFAKGWNDDGTVCRDREAKREQWRNLQAERAEWRDASRYS